MSEAFRHLPVMARQAMELLNPRPGGSYLDGTLGGGGHSALVLEMSSPSGFITGIDRDLEAIEASRAKLSNYEGRFRLIHGAFWDAAAGLAAEGIRFDGFLLDLGVSSHQLDSAGRGFSFRLDGPLDMRMDRGNPGDAAGIVNRATEAELARILKEYGEERWARRIAGAIVAERSKSPVASTTALSEIVSRAVPRRFWEERIHPATRTFQALRIVVNDEIERLQEGITGMFELLVPGGRGVIISFHSLEDRIVKNTFRELASGCECPRNLPVCACNRKPKAKIITTRPVLPGEDEVNDNPRSRSAKMRAVQKL